MAQNSSDAPPAYAQALSSSHFWSAVGLHLSLTRKTLEKASARLERDAISIGIAQIGHLPYNIAGDLAVNKRDELRATIRQAQDECEDLLDRHARDMRCNVDSERQLNEWKSYIKDLILQCHELERRVTRFYREVTKYVRSVEPMQVATRNETDVVLVHRHPSLRSNMTWLE